MIRFNCDYLRSAHPAILQALSADAPNAYGGYGIDVWSYKASALIKELIKAPDADVHFLIGGTQVNYTVITAALRAYQGVLSAASGHINVHETGAVENAGHKVLTVPAVNAKITAAAIEEQAKAFAESDIKEHIVEPKMVYLSQPSEFGTIYSKAELTAISAVCRKYGVRLYLDGARLGYGLAAENNDLTLPDLARLCDAFYIGGTKCGALFGEALVITNDKLKYHFRSYMKQNGALLAKGWLLGLQFYTLFKDGLYFDICRHAVSQAMQIRRAWQERGLPFYLDSMTNQQFVIVTTAQMEALSTQFVFDYQMPLAEDRNCIRQCTSCSTTAAEADALTAAIHSL